MAMAIFNSNAAGTTASSFEQSYYRCDATTAAYTITLETAGLPLNVGAELTFKKIDSSANAVTVGGTIDGATNFVLATQYSSVTLKDNGTNWDILSSRP